jgi:hypothetical protein
MNIVFSGLIALLLSLASATSIAHAGEKRFFNNIEGRWTGPGQIVAGKFKGTKFVCSFEGVKPGSKHNLLIDGDCRVGLFSQPMRASLSRTARGYSGQFLDGQAGKGMDVIGGKYSASRLDVDIKRHDLDGVMTARLSSEDLLNVTISVHVESSLIPVIDMSLKRVGALNAATVSN